MTKATDQGVKVLTLLVNDIKRRIHGMLELEIPVRFRRAYVQWIVLGDGAR